MRLHRLLGILSILLSRETITAKELAERFEVSIRTIYRDIQAIETAGIPLFAVPGNCGGIGILPEYKLNKTVLSDDEMNYLMTGLSGLRSITDTSKLQILLSKLSTSQSYLTADSDILIDFSAWNKNTTVALKKKVEQIRRAILNQNYLRISYVSAHKRSAIKIAPAKVIFKSAGWYLFGKDVAKEEFRFYKISRIGNIEPLEEQFIPEPVEVPEVWSGDFTPGNGELVTISFAPSAEYQVIDIFGDENYSKELDGSVTVTFPCSSKDWLYHFVLGFGDKAIIVSPDNLKTEFCEYLKKIFKLNHC